MRIRVEWNRCTGIGVCESLAPQRFEVNDAGELQLLGEDIPPELLDSVDAAIEGCPNAALAREL